MFCNLTCSFPLALYYTSTPPSSVTLESSKPRTSSLCSCSLPPICLCPPRLPPPPSHPLIHSPLVSFKPHALVPGFHHLLHPIIYSTQHVFFLYFSLICSALCLFLLGPLHVAPLLPLLPSHHSTPLRSCFLVPLTQLTTIANPRHSPSADNAAAEILADASDLFEPWPRMRCPTKGCRS